MRDAWLAAILVLALAVRLANLWMTAALPVAHYQFTWEEADMATAWRWAERVAAGDVLARDTVHQYTSWMRDIAPPTTWERWWGGRGVFHQAPLYAYALALVRVLGGGGFWAVGLFQLALGLLDVVLVYAIAAHCFDRRAARLAALGAALYAPFLFYETLALRDTLATTTSLAALAAFLAAGISPLRWAGAGLLLAAAILARETTLLFAPVALALAAGRARALPFAAGLVAGLVPLVARNLAVGVAPLALSTRGVEGFVYGHAAGGSAIGLVLPPATRDILTAADGSLVTAVRLTLATWGGNWGGFVAHEFAKLRAVVAAYEAADNVSLAYFAERLPLLRWTLGFPAVLGAGLVGLVVARPRADDRLLRWFLATALLGLMYATLVGRYRLPATAVLLVYAGAGAGWLAARLAPGARGRGAAALAAAGAIGWLSTRALPEAAREPFRATEFVLAAEHWYNRRDLARAAAELDAGFARAPAGPALREDFAAMVPSRIAIALEAGGRAEGARRLEELVAAHPGDGELRRTASVLYRDALRDAARAEAHLAEARRLDAAR